MTKIANEVSAFAAFNGSPDILKIHKKKISKKHLIKDKKLSRLELQKFENEYSKISPLLRKNKKKVKKETSSPSKKSKSGKKGRKSLPTAPSSNLPMEVSDQQTLSEEVSIITPIPETIADSKSKKTSKKRSLVQAGGTKKSLESKKRELANESDEIKESIFSRIPVRKASKTNKSNDSRILGDETILWMIHPHPLKDFFINFFEEKPLHIPRAHNRSYYKDILSTKSFDEMLRNDRIYFGKNLDVTSFTNDKREDHAPDGRAYPSIVWDFYNNGCSLRLLNPQTFSHKVWKLCATLQECMGSMVGANMYLTPPGTQGFAPHYDDVEVFILQLEGKKHWQVYDPPSKLPRFSSPNFSQDDLEEPIMDLVLEAGDLLYMPRGTIHQGNCLEDAHSLHITISCHQRNSYGDLMGKILSQTLETAMEEDEDFRKGLPRDYFDYAGAVHSDRELPQRTQFMNKMKQLFGKLFDYAPIDDGVDIMARDYLHSTLPPLLTAEEAKRTVEGGGERWNANKNRVVNRVEFDPDTSIRLLKANCLRIVKEEDSLRLYYNVENSREYKELDAQFLEVDEESAGAIEHLILSYPNYIKLEKLPIDDLSVKFSLVQNMWERKLIITGEALEAHYDD